MTVCSLDVIWEIAEVASVGFYTTFEAQTSRGLSLEIWLELLQEAARRPESGRDATPS